MPNAHEIIEKIDKFLSRSMLKTSKITKDELINFIETKWREAGDEKYKIYFANIIIHRMINEYIRAHDVSNLARWLDESDKHEQSTRNASHIRDYYKGECWLKCGDEALALEYFYKSYNAEPNYIFTRAPFCYEFLNAYFPSPRELPISEADDDEVEEFKISLPIWAKFFGDKSDKFECVFIDEDGEEMLNLDTESLKQALKFLQENEQLMLTNLLTELLTRYEKMQEIYGYDEEDKADFMPDITDIAGFADLLTLNQIYLIDNGTKLANIGFLFSCSWDMEHGLGIMTLRDKILDIGGAEVAFVC
ncbi:DUF6985 domain-containing protein [Campylobacter sp.]|uniref:DUF6985 domain-containing protein n=1 Tax=Campylobacter sp. TaxID=205 RepID=UPI00270C1D0D|nr:hypothetical protein [Campylobacter sp.]